MRKKDFMQNFKMAQCLEKTRVLKKLCDLILFHNVNDNKTFRKEEYQHAKKKFSSQEIISFQKMDLDDLFS